MDTTHSVDNKAWQSDILSDNSNQYQTTISTSTTPLNTSGVETIEPAQSRMSDKYHYAPSIGPAYACHPSIKSYPETKVLGHSLNLSQKFSSCPIATHKVSWYDKSGLMFPSFIQRNTNPTTSTPQTFGNTSACLLSTMAPSSTMDPNKQFPTQLFVQRTTPRTSLYGHNSPPRQHRLSSDKFQYAQGFSSYELTTNTPRTSSTSSRQDGSDEKSPSTSVSSVCDNGIAVPLSASRRHKDKPPMDTRPAIPPFLANDEHESTQAAGTWALSELDEQYFAIDQGATDLFPTSVTLLDDITPHPLLNAPSDRNLYSQELTYQQPVATIAGTDYSNGNTAAWNAFFDAGPFEPGYFPISSLNETNATSNDPLNTLPRQAGSVDAFSNAMMPQAGSGQHQPYVNAMSGSDLTLHREDPDALLVKWRSAGMTYKDIMAKGGFGKAESTLRGRYRTLTKSREQRPRKPIWRKSDVAALLEGVELFAPNTTNRVRGRRHSSLKQPASLNGVPWMKVSDWMAEHKGTHRYGAATAKKKYVQVIHEQQRLLDESRYPQSSGPD